jgi:hypothetical protein
MPIIRDSGALNEGESPVESRGSRRGARTGGLAREARAHRRDVLPTFTAMAEVPDSKSGGK